MVGAIRTMADVTTRATDMDTTTDTAATAATVALLIRAWQWEFSITGSME